jgi:hypothetical protein
MRPRPQRGKGWRKGAISFPEKEFYGAKFPLPTPS